MIYPYVVLSVLVVGAAIGFQRGWLREIATLGGLLVAWLGVSALGGNLVGVVNRADLIVRFTVNGGFDSTSPGGMLDLLKKAPVVDPHHADTFLGIVVVLVAVASYVAASRYAPPPIAASGRALGVLVGLINGYLLAYLGLRYLAPGARTGYDLGLFSGNLVDELGRYLPTLLIPAVVVTIAIALLNSRKSPSRGSGRIVAGRTKG